MRGSAGAHPRPRSPYIISRAYDWAFFLLSPLAALALGVLVARTPFTEWHFTVAGHRLSPQGLLLGTLIHAHVVAVLFRSHANPEIFQLYRARFVVVPAVLWVALVASPVLAVAAQVLATFWDVWHSGAQTFGLGRIYERNAGNDPEAGRLLDFWLNQLLYAGPIVAGATMLDHFGEFRAFGHVGLDALARVPAFMVRTHASWARALVLGGTGFVAVYLLAYARLWSRGRRVSWLKVWLFATTAMCSIVTWGFNRWGEAFFVMNTFHAVQYLALVWAKEGRRIYAGSRVAHLRFGAPIALAAFLAAVGAYGIAVTLLGATSGGLWALGTVISLSHFWYDGFVWSVSRKQV